MSGDELDDFLLAAAEILESSPQKTLKETDIFSQETNLKVPEREKPPNADKKDKTSLSTIHNGDTDSSDDEDNKYHEERKYNDYGRNIKSMLVPETSSTSLSKRQPPQLSLSSNWKPTTSSSKPFHENPTVDSSRSKSKDVYTDPIFGIRMINPLVSSTALQERMVNRQAVTFTMIKKFVSGNVADKNWVIAGVLANKSTVKTSQKGSQYLIWTLTDLLGDIKTVAVFLFGSAYKEFWKTTPGTVIGILNPTVFDKKENSKDEACLSVENSQRIMVMGQSKDFGTCKSTKKSGEKCTAIVNLGKCDFCVYHIKQEYQKCAKRSELQSAFAGQGLTALRNKVLGKNEVFYAGKSYMAIPAKKSKKMVQKDETRLQSLTGLPTTVPANYKAPKIAKKKVAANLEISKAQRMRDLELLRKLGGADFLPEGGEFSGAHSSEVSLESSKSTALNVIAKLKAKREQEANAPPSTPTPLPVVSNNSPRLSIFPTVPKLSGGENGSVDLNAAISPKSVTRAKLNAIKFIKNHGTLKKTDPNNVKKSPSVNTKKRVLEEIDNCCEKGPKKKKIEENEFLSDRFKKMMQATSNHTDLLEVRDNEEQEKYFDKLEMKEKMEEKMTNTFKMACKAVRCLKCKYTNFSASDKCKEERHPLRVFDAMKRFFKCGNCGNRTVSLDVVPTVACKNCGSGKWERTGMMKEKMVAVAHKLSIRGGEQTFVNSIASNSNLDLMVPDGDS